MTTERRTQRPPNKSDPDCRLGKESMAPIVEHYRTLFRRTSLSLAPNFRVACHSSPQCAPRGGATRTVLLGLLLVSLAGENSMTSRVCPRPPFGGYKIRVISQNKLVLQPPGIGLIPLPLLPDDAW